MAAQIDLSVETHVVSPGTTTTVVRADHCEALASRQIAHVAVVDATAPYVVVRTHLSGAFLQVCLAGVGQTLLDGKWYPHKPGMASFSPAHVPHAFHCVPGKRWRVAWVRFMPGSPRSAHGALSPSMMDFQGNTRCYRVFRKTLVLVPSPSDFQITRVESINRGSAWGACRTPKPVRKEYLSPALRQFHRRGRGEQRPSMRRGRTKRLLAIND